MKRTKVMGLCLVAVCAIFAFVATSAFAFENRPHYGKCNLVPEGTGTYANSGCTKLGGTKKYEWAPLGATETIAFTSLKETGTGEAELEGASGIEIFCSGQKESKGEYGGGDKVKGVIGEFSGCKALGVPCKSEKQEEGLINTFALTGEPGIVKKEAKEEKNIVGNDLVGEAGGFAAGELANFICGTLTVVVKKGIVTEARADGVNTSNKMLNSVEVEFNAEKGGTQVPNKWSPNGNGTVHSETKEIEEQLHSSFNGGAEELSGQSLTTVQKTKTKAKVELRMCEKTISCPN